MRRFGIIVATEKYAHFSPTPFCHADAKLLHSTLTSDLDYADQDVLLMLLDPSDTKYPSDVLAAIEGVVDKAKDGDTILFYYAGHGDYYDDDAYLILPSTKPSDKKKTALPLRDISSRLRDGNRINVRIFDACHSGYDVRSADVENVNAPEFGPRSPFCEPSVPRCPADPHLRCGPPAHPALG